MKNIKFILVASLACGSINAGETRHVGLTKKYMACAKLITYSSLMGVSIPMFSVFTACVVVESLVQKRGVPIYPALLACGAGTLFVYSHQKLKMTLQEIREIKQTEQEVKTKIS